MFVCLFFVVGGVVVVVVVSEVEVGKKEEKKMRFLLLNVFFCCCHLSLPRWPFFSPKIIHSPSSRKTEACLERMRDDGDFETNKRKTNSSLSFVSLPRPRDCLRQREKKNVGSTKKKKQSSCRRPPVEKNLSQTHLEPRLFQRHEPPCRLFLGLVDLYVRENVIYVKRIER